MRFFGRGLPVCVLACVCLLPARSEAAILGPPADLGTLSSGNFNFDGALSESGDIALLFRFETLETTFLTVDLTAGFDSILTLFGPIVDPDPSVVIFDGLYQYLTDSDATLFSDPIQLGPGGYLVALSQFPNLFNPFSSGAFPGGFDSENDPGFNDRFFPTCSFVDRLGECGTGDFAGSLSVEAQVPEPGTLSLLTLGGAALAAWRRRRGRSQDSEAFNGS